MKKLLITTILMSSFCLFSFAQEEKKVESSKTQINVKRGALKSKSQKALTTPEKNKVRLEENTSNNGNSTRAKAVSKKPAEPIKLKKTSEGVILENNQQVTKPKDQEKVKSPKSTTKKE